MSRNLGVKFWNLQTLVSNYCTMVSNIVVNIKNFENFKLVDILIILSPLSNTTLSHYELNY